MTDQFKEVKIDEFWKVVTRFRCKSLTCNSVQTLFIAKGQTKGEIIQNPNGKVQYKIRKGI